MLPKIDVDGYDEFETIAKTFNREIQAQLNLKLADGRESALSIGEIDPELNEYGTNLIKFISPLPDETGRKIAEKSLAFGAYLGVLLSQPDEPTLSMVNLSQAETLDEIQMYINCAPREYLRNRPNILGLISRNLLQPAPRPNQAKLVLKFAGLAVLQCEEGRVEAFLSEQDAKLASELEKMGGVLPDDWQR